MPRIIDNEEYYNTKEASKYLGVTRGTLYNYVQEGLLIQYKQGIARTNYYLKSELDELLRMKPKNGR